MVFRVTDNSDLSAVRADDLTLRHGVGSVVGALCMNVRADNTNDLFDGRLVKYRDGVDKAKRRDDLCAFVFRDCGTAVSFERTHLPIRIYCNEQLAAECLCSRKVADVTGMDKVKAAIREDQPL